MRTASWAGLKIKLWGYGRLGIRLVLTDKNARFFEAFQLISVGLEYFGQDILLVKTVKHVSLVGWLKVAQIRVLWNDLGQAFA